MKVSKIAWRVKEINYHKPKEVEIRPIQIYKAAFKQ